MIDEYCGNNKKIRMKCLRCNYEWKVVPSSVLNGSKCPNCIASGTSFMEKIIFYSVVDVFGENFVLSRYKALIGKELDIYIPELKLAIEPGSWFWHQKKIQNDREKRQLCENVGVRLITIYDSFDLEKNDLIFKDCWTYTENFSEERNSSILRSVVERLYKEMGISQIISDDDWNDIKKLAYYNTRQMTSEELREKISDIKPEIEVLGDFTHMKNQIKVQCKNCGYIWDSTPERIIRGSGCRKCGRKICGNKLRMSQEEYEKQLYNINPNIEVLGQYTNSSAPITVKCRICGHIWTAIASSLTSANRGCPACWASRRGQTLRKTHSEFMKSFNEKGNRNIDILGKYEGSKIPIMVKCKICNREWSTTPNQLLAGVGCAACAGKMQKSNQHFLEELKVAHPEIVALTPYKNADTKIEVKCNMCGHVWKVRPVSLIKKEGSGCPKCGQKRSSEKQRRTTDQYKTELFEINPSIEVLGEYVNANTKSLVKCKKCNYEWMAKPSYFLNSHRGCPKCNELQKNPAILCMETDTIYNNIQDAIEFAGLKGGESIIKCCKGKQKTAGGYHWKYYKDQS
mgnify:CR=1 FL=1